MKKLFLFLSITAFFASVNSLFAQTINKAETKPSIEYPFPGAEKVFLRGFKSSKTGLGSKNAIVYSFDKKQGFWFVENDNLHHYDIDKKVWKLFNKETGLFEGRIGVIFHDSQGQTWVGSQRDPFFDGYGAKRLYKGGISVYDGGNLKTFDKQEIKTSSAEILDIIEDADGRIFVATGEDPALGVASNAWPGGLVVYENNTWMNYSKGEPKCPFKFIEKFHLDSRKKVWMENGKNKVGSLVVKSLCYFEDGNFTTLNLKGMLLDVAFSEKNIWAITWVSPKAPRIYKYNPSSSEFEKLKEKLEMTAVYRSTVFNDDLVVFYIGSKALYANSSNKRLKAQKELKIQIIDGSNIVNASDHDLTKKLFFNCGAPSRKNEALFGTNEGIIVYKNGDFFREKIFDILDNKPIKEIFVTSGNQLFIVCENSELYFYDETLEKVDLSNDRASITNIGETDSGDVYVTTNSKAFMLKVESNNCTAREIFNRLEYCYQVAEFKNSLYFLCANGIFSTPVN